MVARSVLLSTIIASLAALVVVDAHSFLVKPKARDNGVHSDTGNTMGCPTKTKSTVSSFRAGEQIDVRYWRNNHIGGFIRWSLAPSGDEKHDTFDKYAFYYTCRESGPDCVPKKNPNEPIVGDNSDANTISCGDKITLPDWLPAGDYVLQWTWFGVGHSNGNLGWAEPQFRSCADIRLTTSGTKSTAPKCPTFVGGDRVTKAQNKSSDQCFYFYTTDIVSTWYKGSNDKAIAMPLYKFGKPAAVTRCGGSSGVGNSTTDSSHTSDDDAGNDAEVTPLPTTKAPGVSKPPTTSDMPKPITTAPSTTTPKPTTTPKATTKTPSCRRKED